MSGNENLLQLQNGSKSFGTRFLFQKAEFAVNENEHIGVIGPNGAGKSTLFRILIGEEALDDGQIIKSRNLSLGYLSQHDHWEAQETGDEYLARNSKMPLWDLKSLGRRLQLSEEILAKPITSLSGGYRMRIKLLGLIGQEPNLMLLDEPTNYLDLETTLLLEKFLQNFEGAFLLISHDREFLRRTTDHIVEVEAGEITKYNGNIDDYFEQKELLSQQLEARAQGLQEKRKAVLDFVARFGAKATKAKQAQSRMKQLNKMEVIDIKPLQNVASIKVPPPTHTGKFILTTEDANFGYGDRTILKKVKLQILRGDHVAVVGLNGAGKSTLLKGLSGTMAPMTGTSELGFGVKIAFFNQHVVESLDANDTVYTSLASAAHPDVLRQEILDMAGSLLFSGNDIQKKVSVLSGGEASRVALGRVLLQKAPCMILDEPTNHLDFQTVEALTLSLQKYEGTVIVVSHDRSFIRRVGTKILEVSGGNVHLYPGTYDEYVWSLEKQMGTFSNSSESETKTKAKPVTPASVQKQGSWREQKKDLERQLRTCEKKFKETETALSEKQHKLTELNQQIIDQPALAFKLIEELTLVTESIQKLEAQWLTLSEDQERLQNELASLKG